MDYWKLAKLILAIVLALLEYLKQRGYMKLGPELTCKMVVSPLFHAIYTGAG